MPKEAIRFAARDIANENRKDGHHGVWVPKRSKLSKCNWDQGGKKHNRVWLDFDMLIDILEFSLDHAYVTMPDGRLLRQVSGIPMGDPMSPAMTIGTCGFMEREWMHTLDSETKNRFRAKRYMDDVIVMMAENEKWDHAKFSQDIGNDVYWPPLKLEDGGQGVFLETYFAVTQGGIQTRLKNLNEGRVENPAVWRYQHFNSYGEYTQKRSTLAACLSKVQNMASDSQQLMYSALQKLDEFKRLEYPLGIRKYMCMKMALNGGDATWWKIRDAQK